MSTTTDEHRLLECRQCGDLYPATSLLGGRFCSDECRTEHRRFADEFDENYYPCEHCGDGVHEDATVKGSFCSEACWYRHKGHRALDQIASDHRWCATCFRQIKTVIRPPDSKSVDVEGPIHEGRTDAGPKDVLVGWQFQTEHTAWGLDDVSDDEYRTLDRQRWSCKCGNVDPSARDDILEGVEIETIVTDLLRCLTHLAAHGGLSREPDPDRLFAALREHWRDWEYAIGRALYEP